MNYIHPTAVVYDGVELGEGNHIGPFCVLYPGVVVGDDNVFTSHCSVGAPPQHLKKSQKFTLTPDFKTFVGNGNVLREFVTVHQGVERSTFVSNNCMMMAYSHVSHDTLIQDNVILANNVQIGGHSCVMAYANLGLSSVIHQFSLIGPGVMLGMNSLISKSAVVEPFGKYVGSPAKLISENVYVINKLEASEIELLSDEYVSTAASGYYLNVRK